jgi:hypothetical protein
MEIKYVIVERKNMSGRYVALRNLSFTTKEAAQGHINTKFNERFRNRFHVESRLIKADNTELRSTASAAVARS